MKALAFTFVVFLAAALVVAEDEAAPPAPATFLPTAAPTPAKSAKILKGEVVAADPAGTITYKTTYGDEKTAAVEADLSEKLGTLKVGDKVMLVLRDEGGEETVTVLKKTGSAKSPSPPSAATATASK